MAKTNFNMQLSDTQKEIMDFTTDVIFNGQFSKAGVVLELFKSEALNYLSYPADCDLSDEIILSALLSHKREEDSKLIGFLGTAQYRKVVDEFKKNYPDSDSSYQEQLLIDFVAQYGEVVKPNVTVTEVDK
jgi:hypothetical protein